MSEPYDADEKYEFDDDESGPEGEYETKTFGPCPPAPGPVLE